MVYSVKSVFMNGESSRDQQLNLDAYLNISYEINSK